MKPYLIIIIMLLTISCGSDAQTGSNIQISANKKVYIDGDDIRSSAGGSRVLYIDGSDIRPQPGGKRLLFLDGSDIRPEPGGPRLAFWDGSTLRRTPGGKILLKIDGYTIRNAEGQKMLSFEPGNYSQAQITAALYYLNANIFKPSAEELAAAQAAIAEGQAWDKEQASNEKENGEYDIINGSGDYDEAGKCQIKWISNHYAISFAKYGLTGVATKRDDSGFHITGALGIGSYHTGIFTLKGNTYSGSWYDHPNSKSVAQDDFTADVQNLTVLQSSSMGTLTFTATRQKLDGEGKIYDVTSSNGKSGKALEVGNPTVGMSLIIALGDDVAVINFKSSGNGFVGDYAGNKTSGYLVYTEVIK